MLSFVLGNEMGFPGAADCYKGREGKRHMSVQLINMSTWNQGVVFCLSAAELIVFV